MKRFIIVFILLFFLSISLYAQSLDYKINKPQKLFIGTPFQVLVEIKTNPADTIFSPEIDTLDIFILKGEIEQTEEIIANEKITNLILTFQPFDTGEFTFPELEFAVKSTDSIDFLKTSEFQVNIESVITDTSTAIKDIARPLSVNLGFWDYMIPILVIFLLVFLVIYLKKLLKKKPLEEEKTIIFDDRPAYLIALELLENLQKQKLLGKGDFLNFHFHLSMILRLFIELYYKIKAVEMTTSEIRHNLKLNDFKEKTKILDFLTFSDKVKFSKFTSTLKESENAFEWLKQYLISFQKAEQEKGKEIKDV